MKKANSSNKQNASHAEGQGNNIPSTGKEGKVNNSQSMNDMREKSARPTTPDEKQQGTARGEDKEEEL